MKRYGRKRFNKKQQIDKGEKSKIGENIKSNKKKSKYDLHKSKSILPKKKRNKNKTVRFSETVHKTIITDVPYNEEEQNNNEPIKKDWDITFNVEVLN
jgi:hypothetical protein